MATLSRCRLRIRSTALPVASIVAAMNAPPTAAHDAGDPLGRTQPRPRGDALACFDSPLPRTADLAEHIAERVAFVRSRLSAIETLRASCEMDLFCMVASDNGQGSCVLEPTLMAALAELGLPLVLDVYPPSRE